MVYILQRSIGDNLWRRIKSRSIRSAQILLLAGPRGPCLNTHVYGGPKPPLQRQTKSSLASPRTPLPTSAFHKS